VQLSGTEAGGIYVFDDLQHAFHLRATYGMDQELIATLTQQHIGMDEPNVATVFAEREPTQVADLRQEVSVILGIAASATRLRADTAECNEGEPAESNSSLRRLICGTQTFFLLSFIAL
jgi:hypothetical protein